MTTFSASLSNPTVFHPQQQNCSCYVSRPILPPAALSLQKPADLRAHDLAHSPDVLHHPRLTNISSAWSWRLCGNNPVIFVSGTEGGTKSLSSNMTLTCFPIAWSHKLGIWVCLRNTVVLCCYREPHELLKPAVLNSASVRFHRYLQAARDGQDQKDCLKLYPTCTVRTEWCHLIKSRSTTEILFCSKNKNYFYRFLNYSRGGFIWRV
jgi:hypothetical protein